MTCEAQSGHSHVTSHGQSLIACALTWKSGRKLKLGMHMTRQTQSLTIDSRHGNAITAEADMWSKARYRHVTRHGQSLKVVS